MKKPKLSDLAQSVKQFNQSAKYAMKMCDAREAVIEAAKKWCNSSFDTSNLVDAVRELENVEKNK